MSNNDYYKQQLKKCEAWLHEQMEFLITLPVSDARKEELRASISSTVKALAAMSVEIPPSPPKLPVYVVTEIGVFDIVRGAYLRQDKALDVAKSVMKQLAGENPKLPPFELLDDDGDDPIRQIWEQGRHGTRVVMQRYDVEP